MTDSPLCVCVIQHVDCETPGLLDDVLREQGVTTTIICAHRGQAVPRDLTAFDGLILMGRPEGVYEQTQYPYLTAEIRLLETALHANKPILGTCLGSQLLATALGATVVKGRQKEIGWYDLTLTPETQQDRLFRGLPGTFTGLHWHGDVFNLPRGAVHLASSALTPTQAFRHGTTAYGLLFHMEMTERIIRDLTVECAAELREAGVAVSAIRDGIPPHLSALHQLGRPVYGRWVELLRRS